MFLMIAQHLNQDNYRNGGSELSPKNPKEPKTAKMDHVRISVIMTFWAIWPEFGYQNAEMK